jgi:DNA processing protein
MAEHGTATAALQALPDVARAAGVATYSPCPHGVAQAEYRAGLAAGAQMICIGDAVYPAALAAIADAPPILWVVGDPAILSRPMLAMVGARNASSLGGRMARGLARELGEAGYVIVSGLARGIDTAAHAATLETGTVAVQAGGVDVLYPAENADLAHDIAAHGLRISEQPMGLIPQARHFPRRNRIISGLVQAVLVIEAAAKSGSLITARCALDQGREVMAVPGHPFDARAAGCNMLIRDGARLVRNAADVIEALSPLAPSLPDLSLSTLSPPASHMPNPAAPLPARSKGGSPTSSPPPSPPPDRRSLQETAALHGQILNRLGPSPVPEDQLIRDLDTAPRHVSPALVSLELEGQINRQPGGMLSRLT